MWLDSSARVGRKSVQWLSICGAYFPTNTQPRCNFPGLPGAVLAPHVLPWERPAEHLPGRVAALSAGHATLGSLVFKLRFVEVAAHSKNNVGIHAGGITQTQKFAQCHQCVEDKF